MNRGKWLIVGIFALASCLALFAWNHQRLRGQNVLNFYGDEVALLIRLAPRVDLWQFDTPVDNNQVTPFLQELSTEDSIENARRVSLAERPGWTHARQALIEDRSYDWNAPAPSDCHWTHLIRFQREGRKAVLLLDLANGRIRLPQGGRIIALNSKMAEGFRQFMSDQPPSR